MIATQRIGSQDHGVPLSRRYPAKGVVDYWGRRKDGQEVALRVRGDRVKIREHIMHRWREGPYTTWTDGPLIVKLLDGTTITFRRD